MRAGCIIACFFVPAKEAQSGWLPRQGHVPVLPSSKQAKFQTKILTLPQVNEY